MNKLRVAREFCFQYFFHMQLPVFEELREEYIQNENDDLVKSSIDDFKTTTDTLLDSELNEVIINRILGTLQNYKSIEETIEKNLKKWKLSRLSKVDHTNLMLSVFELCFEKKTPINIIINEAIEISKKFGTEESASFINGVLDNIAKSEK